MTEDNSKKPSTDVSPATDEFPAASSADPFAPQQDNKVPPPMSFAGSAGTGAINVGAAPDTAQTGMAQTTIAPHASATSVMPQTTTPSDASTTSVMPQTTTPSDASTTSGASPEQDADIPIVLDPLPIDTGSEPTATTPPVRTAARRGNIGKTTGTASAPTAASPSPATPAAPAKPSDKTPVTAGPAEHSFQLLSFVALFSLALILAVQQFTSVYVPSIFTPSELGFAGMYEHMLASSQWLAPPHLANIPASLPVYFWFMRLVDAIPYADGSLLYPLVSACSAFVALAGVYTLGLTAGLGNRVAFAAGLILLSSLGFSPLGHYLSPDLFFAGTLAFSMACLYRGWISQVSYLWLALGFALAGISTLTGGLMGLVVPLLSSLGFVVWRGSFRRGHQLDAVFGFALLLIIILGWLGAIILLTGENTYLYTLSRQIFAPFIGPLWPPQDPWWLYGVRVPAALMPWVLVVLFVPWGRVCAKAWPNLKASRTEKAGHAWLWIALFVSCLYISATSTKPCLAFVPVLPFAALLLAKALLNLPQGRSRAFFLLLAVGFAVAALMLAAVGIPFVLTALSPYLPAPLMQPLETMQGLPLMAGVCALGALVLWKGTRRSLPAGALLVTVLLVTMLVQPGPLLLSPSLTGIVGQPLSTDEAHMDNAAVPAPNTYPQDVPATLEADPALPDTPLLPPAPPAPPVAPVLPTHPVPAEPMGTTETTPPTVPGTQGTLGTAETQGTPKALGESGSSPAANRSPALTAPIAPSAAPNAPARTAPSATPAQPEKTTTPALVPPAAVKP